MHKSTEIFKNAITYRAFNSGGPGGQHSNRSENAIEASLRAEVAAKLGIPALSATASLKSQVQSKKAAAKLLKSKISYELVKRNAKGRFAAGSERVRTYHEPNDRVTDSSGFTASFKHTVGKGDIGELVDKRRSALQVSQAD